MGHTIVAAADKTHCAVSHMLPAADPLFSKHREQGQDVRNKDRRLALTVIIKVGAATETE